MRCSIGCMRTADGPATAPGPARLGRALAAATGWLLLAVAMLALGGCAALPPLPERTPSHAVLASDATALGRHAMRSLPVPGVSGFRLLPTGGHAFDARLALIERAERALDLQVFILQDDAAGHTMLRALRDAAARGVRVRLLVDDMYTAGTDELLLALAAHAGVEVRLFNPFPAARERTTWRFVAGLADVVRLSRRMHNKLLVSDGAMAIAGGRNVASEYFAFNDEANFIDLDLLALGPVTDELARQFDRYWHSRVAYPVQAIARSALGPAQLRASFERLTDSARPRSVPTHERDPAGHRPLSLDLADATQPLPMVWAEAQVVADRPEKVLGEGVAYGDMPLQDTETVRFNVTQALAQARQEVLLVSPYLVPGRDGMAVLRQVRGRGVEVLALTNSMASTDEVVVHAGYRRYRPALLRLGVRLHELSPSRVNRYLRLGLFQTPGRLHTKAALFDRQHIFIGSMNLDPRSERHNTELGLLLTSAELGSQLRHLLLTEIDQSAYRVRLKADGHDLQWVSYDGESVFENEPGVPWWDRWILNLLAPLVPEDLL
jgi:putative cardiolipin synthase